MGKADGVGLPPTYWGARLSSDAMDCDVPFAVDSRSGCTFTCLYCFSHNLMRAKHRNTLIKQKLERLSSPQTEFPVEKLVKLLTGQFNNAWSRVLDPLIKQKMPMQLGALGDPFDAMEIATGWFLKAAPILKKLEYPVRISTKGGKCILRPEYLEAFKGGPFWTAFSIITSDDKLAAKIERGVPSPTTRFEAMKALSDMGLKTSLRFRPIIPPVARRKIGGRFDWEIMVDKAVEAGAQAISFEYIFLNQMASWKERGYYRQLSEAIGMPDFPQFWKHHSIRNQVCLRANRFYKYDLMMNIRNYAKQRGLTVGISDPHFKEFGDHGSCCGISRDDPVFGHYSTSMTDIVTAGRKAYEQNGENLQFTFTDWSPDWAKNVRLGAMCNLGNKLTEAVHRETTWYEQMRKHWNTPRYMRSPTNYFEGILWPIGLDDNKNVIYEYRHWATQVWPHPEKLPKLKYPTPEA